MTRLVAWIAFLALVVLHVDVWRGPRPGVFFGWLPEDMAYRLLWMAAAFLYLLFFNAKIWDEAGNEAGDDAGGEGG